MTWNREEEPPVSASLAAQLCPVRWNNDKCPKDFLLSGPSGIFISLRVQAVSAPARSGRSL